MYALDLLTMNWEKVPTTGDVPHGRAGHTACVYGDCIYYFGGNYFESIQAQQFFNTLYIFNTTTRTWTKDPADTSQILGRYHHAAEVVGEKMYIYGGKAKDNKDLNDIYVYDFASGAWIPHFEVSGVVPTARNHAGSAVYDQNLIIYGGSSTTDVFNSVFVFDTDLSTWKLLTLPLDMPARKGHTMAVVRPTMRLFLHCRYSS
jgi:N-acetylneuraminic acid mutarotase